MWDDLYAAFINDPKELYFFGSMVLIGNEGDLNFEVVDGQQRITSTALMFVAIRCFLEDKKIGIINEDLKERIAENIVNLDELIYNKKVFGATTREKKIKIERNAGFDYDSRLSEVFACSIFDPNSVKRLTDEQCEVITRYYKNKEYFQERLIDNFNNEDGSFDYQNAERLNNFIEFLKNKVSIVEILTMKLEIAYHIFEILNNRGLPLSNKDLFRNFILKEFDKLKNSNETYKHIDPSSKWQELDEDNILDNEFLSRWIESSTAAQQKKSAYNDIEEIYRTKYKDDGLRKKIEIFHADIKSALPYYQKIMERDFENPRLKQKINVIMNAGNTKYSINFLMALLNYSNGKETDEVIEAVNIYEIRIWIGLLADRFRSNYVFNSISNINSKNIKKAESKLVSPESSPEFTRSFFANLMDRITSNDVAKLLIAKYAWILESETTNDVVFQELDYDSCTLEHIYPQKPFKASNWFNGDFIANGRQYDGIYKLGNMTLVTHKLNSSMKNYGFYWKKMEYEKTKLAITHVLSTLPEIEMTAEYLQKRHEKIVNKILADLEL